MTHDIHPLHDDGMLPDALRWQLRAQRRDVEPPRDLWPGIAARLAETPQRRSTDRRSALPRLAIAAGLVVAIGATLLLQRTAVAPVPDHGVARAEAATVVDAYSRALRQVPATGAPAEIAPALAELDRSTHQIRQALRRDPDSRLLLDQLRRTYALRLALSQRAAVG